VARNRENPGGAVDYPSGAVSSLSCPHSPDSDGADANAEADPKPVAPELDTVDTVNTVDADDLADVPREVLAEAEAAALAVIDRYRRREAETHDR
jgi:hypothetical protein